MRRYAVGAQQYFGTPARLKSLVSGLGLPDGHYPKPYLDYYDSLNLLILLVFHENGSFEFLDSRFADSLKHVGGTSGRSRFSADLFHTYADLKFLELVNCPALSQAYAKLGCGFSSCEELLACNEHIPGVIQYARNINSIADTLIKVQDKR